VPRPTRFGAILAGAALTAAVLTSCSEPLPEAAEPDAATDTVSEACAEDLLACARQTMLVDQVPDEPTEATGEPIRLGMINQENTAAGSYPELSQAVLAATEFLNEELGGVGGRPIEIEVCNTEFSAEGSVACAQRFVEAEVPAVLGGIDVFGNAVATLADNGVPYVGGIPISEGSVTSPNSFQWSGGGWATAVAFAWYAATELDAKRVSVVYADFGAIADSAEMARTVLEGYGAEVQLVPYPVMATDMSSALAAAADADPDAMFVLAADAGCTAGFDGVAALGIDAAMFYSGACAAPTIIDRAGFEKTNGTYFNVENPIGTDPVDPDMELYGAVIDTYGDGLDPIGAGTVSFKSIMNLFVVMSEIEGELTPAAITEALQAQVDAPSFGSHPYTCDGEQFEGLPALCSPQQIMTQMSEGKLEQVSDWIDVGQIYQG
jgi:branched-chain amino acid transport system substrate-binding protein